MISNFIVESITRNDGNISIIYTYTRAFDGGTDEDGEERGLVDRSFEGNSNFIEDDEITDEALIAEVKRNLGIK